jgi:hypothetical protein
MLMSAAQAIASSRFLTAMGPMIEDEQKMNEVLEYIESIKIQPLRKQITLEELDKRGMPLHQAMDKLREKAREYYQA